VPKKPEDQYDEKEKSRAARFNGAATVIRAA